MFEDPSRAEYAWDNAARVVVMIENRDGSRQFCEFPNLIGPVTVAQETEHFRDYWSGNTVRSVQRGPVEISVPQHGTWYLHDPGIVPDFTPTHEQPALPAGEKSIEP